jgi:glucokinase
MTRADSPPRLLADIGGTNVRFVLDDPRAGLAASRVLAVRDFPDVVAAAEAYLDELRPPVPPAAAAFAVACPVTGDVVDLTNHPWTFSISAVREQLGLDRLLVVNDFTAIALALPHLSTADVEKIGGGEPVADTPIGLIGPGTGLGVSGLVPAGAGIWVPLSSEGGHVTAAPIDDRESAVLAVLRRRLGHVSAERVLSGPGLVNLYHALTELEGRTPEPVSPETVSQKATAGTCPRAVEAVALFCAMLGTTAGNLALTLGARGGIYVAGGIVPQLGPLFGASSFRSRFQEKGRFVDYLSPVPTYVIIRDVPAFLGLRALFDQPGR